MNYRVIPMSMVFFAIFLQSVCAQVITSVTPNSATPGSSLDVLVRGINTHFQNGISVADFGPGVIVKKFYVSNQITGTATIQIENPVSPGFRTIRVQTGNELAVIENEFEIFSGSGSLRANIELLPVETISLSDLDLTIPQNSPILFFVNLYNDNVTRKVRIFVSLSSKSLGYIGKMSTKQRTLSPDAYQRLTNRDFTGIDLNGNTGKYFLAQVKLLGTFPPDDYIYKLEIVDETGNILATDEDVNIVTNPRANPELIIPGANFQQNLEPIYTPFPLFQWFGQMNAYDFSLYEIREGQTPEEAVRNIAVFQKKDITSTNLLYPNYAEKLVSGKVYAWQILGKIISTKGTQFLPSEVFRFRYSKAGTDNNSYVVAKIEINPPNASIKINEALQFVATCYNEDGNILPGIPIQWSVTPHIGTITSDGLFTANKETGVAAVVAKAGMNNTSEFAVVKVELFSEADAGDWMIREMFKKILGITEE